MDLYDRFSREYWIKIPNDRTKRFILILASCKIRVSVRDMYKSRIADGLLARKIAGKGAVLIEGPKWCGKTTTATQQAKSLLDLGDSKVLNNSRTMFEIDPYVLLDGETPRLIDEWQTIPDLWDTIRSAVDKRSETSQFILTYLTVTQRNESN